MKFVVIALLMALGLYLSAASQAERAYDFCVQAKGLPSSAIEARLGKHYEVRDGLHRYDPTWIYSMMYNNDIAVQYNRQWRAMRVRCGEP
ncbi:hypothetical protein BGP77_15845 [Saccharospirillum sp. MSK14-1]|uniref:hypothetical protein n=1 Tax=Saccharospirillum sp. MSK14-1 TaxID=1897632 RepID=UPI000D3CAF49|nr:hypothetical protein [Saccharospirillum sp. MSK14-1]PTY37931.1 hypothetical protein BGP77_15845 [Saccharospirillum sp. MSK14-1]